MNVQNIVWNWSERYCYSICLDEREHVGENLSMRLKRCRVRGVCYDTEDLHQDVCEVGLIKALRRLRVLLEILQKLQKKREGKK